MPLTRKQQELEVSKLFQQDQEKSKAKAKTSKPSPSSRPGPTPATTAPHQVQAAATAAPPNPQTNINRRITRRTAAILDSHDKSTNPFSSATGSSSPKGPTLLDLSDGILSHIFNHIQVIEESESHSLFLCGKPSLPPYYSLRYILPLVCKRFHFVSSQPSSVWSFIILTFNARGSCTNKEMEHFQAHLFQQWLRPRASAVKEFRVINFNKGGVHPVFLNTWAVTETTTNNNGEEKGKGKPTRQSKRNHSTTQLKTKINSGPTLATPPIVSILKMFGENLDILSIESCPNLIRNSATLKSILEAVPKLKHLTLYGLPEGINKDAFRPLKDLTNLRYLYIEVPDDSEVGNGARRQAANANNNNAAAPAAPVLDHINPLHCNADHPTYQALHLLILNNATHIETEYIGDHLKHLTSLHLSSPSPTLTNLSGLRPLSNLDRLKFSDNHRSRPAMFTDIMWIDLSYFHRINTLEIYSSNDMKLQIRDVGIESLPAHGFSGLTTVSTLVITGCAMDVPMRVVGEHDDDDENDGLQELFNRTCTNAMEGLHHFPNLTTLKITNSRLCSILPPPGKMPFLSKLVHIDISGNSLVDLPEAFLGNVPALEYLYASNNLFPCIPPGVARLSHLKHLDLSDSMYMEVEGPLDWMLSSGPSIKKSAGYRFVGPRQLYTYGPGEVVNEEVEVENLKSLQWMKVTKSVFRFKESSVGWLVDVKAKFWGRGQMVEVEYTK